MIAICNSLLNVTSFYVSYKVTLCHVMAMKIAILTDTGKENSLFLNYATILCPRNMFYFF